MFGARGLPFGHFGFECVSLTSFHHSEHWFNVRGMGLFLLLEHFQVITKVINWSNFKIVFSENKEAKREWESQENSSLKAKSKDMHLAVKFINPS